MFNSNVKKMALAVALCGLAQGAFAHTGVKDQVTEGTNSYNGFTITHGCTPGEGTGTPLPVIAQTAVFPNASDSVAFKINTSTTPATEEPVNLADYIVGAAGGPTTFGITGIQDKSVFNKTKIIYAGTTKRGFQFTGGNLQTDLTGIPPFRITGPKFVTTSCAKSLKVRVAIGNWCNKSKSADDDRRVDVWIGKLTTKFNDTGVVSVGYWPTLTVNRNLTTNPLPAECGAGFDVAVQPSDADIDASLPLPGYWPANAQ